MSALGLNEDKKLHGDRRSAVQGDVADFPRTGGKNLVQLIQDGNSRQRERQGRSTQDVVPRVAEILPPQAPNKSQLRSP